MYLTSEAWKQKIYNADTEHILKIYIDNIEINPDYILGFNITHKLYTDDILSLGSTPTKKVELKLYKDIITLPITEIRVEYGIKIDTEYEIIPIGIFKLEKYEELDDSTISIVAVDSMINFEFNYDASTLTLPATLLEVLQDICTKAGVELGTISFLNQDKQINVYDNTITARKYLGYIAESADCFAFIGRDNKLYLKRLYEGEAIIDIELFGDFKWGAECCISKVTYQDGIRNFTFGDDTHNTLWIDPDNVYIVDQQQIEEIFNNITGFLTTSFEGTAIIDPALDLGDKLIIDGKSVLFQYNMDYISRFKASIVSNIQSKEKEDTVVKTGENIKLRKLQTQIDQTNGNITIIAAEQSNQGNLITEIKSTVDNVNINVSNSVGNNLLPNSTLKLGLDKKVTVSGTVSFEDFMDVVKNTTSKTSYKINSGYVKYDRVFCEPGTYTLSFKNLRKANTNPYVEVYAGLNLLLDLNVKEDAFEEVILNIDNTVGYIDVKIGCNENYCLVSDVMLNSGTNKLTFSLYPGEIVSTNYKFSNDNGMELTSSVKKTKLVANAEELAIYNTENNEKPVSFNKDNTDLTRATVKNRFNVGKLRHTVLDNGDVMLTFDD